MTGTGAALSGAQAEIAAAIIEARGFKLESNDTPDRVAAAAFVFDNGILYLPEDSRKEIAALLRSVALSQLRHGWTYRNFRGDQLGPMDERMLDHFLDQYGTGYYADGRQWDHVPGSTGNIDLSTGRLALTNGGPNAD